MRFSELIMTSIWPLINLFLIFFLCDTFSDLKIKIYTVVYPHIKVKNYFKYLFNLKNMYNYLHKAWSILLNIFFSLTRPVKNVFCHKSETLLVQCKVTIIAIRHCLKITGLTSLGKKFEVESKGSKEKHMYQDLVGKNTARQKLDTRKTGKGLLIIFYVKWVFVFGVDCG